MVIKISSSSNHSAWFRIPELHDAYRRLQTDARNGDYEKVKQSLLFFKRTAITCDDPLQSDAIRLVNLVGSEVTAAMPPVRTRRTVASRELSAWIVTRITFKTKL